jgi:uncharacterized membrane protein YbhN (UPF0104 family)
MKARLFGAKLPEVPAAGRQPGLHAGGRGRTGLHPDGGGRHRGCALHVCADGNPTQVLTGPDDRRPIALASTSGDTVWVEKQGVQRVPMTVEDLWKEVKTLDLAVFIPWVLFATFVKFLGIIANIVRWQVLLAGQELHFGFGWLTASYFVGRFFGIVMPSTLGLDGWRLYDTIRVSRKPVQCATVLAIERVTGLVGLLATILLFMPFADLRGRGIADVLQSMAAPLGAALLFGLMLLVRPDFFVPLIRLIPVAKVRTFLDNAVRSATAYSTRRGTLLIALLCAIFGQVTTMAMYFGNAMALQVEGVTMLQVFYAGAVMTLFTFLIPTAAGEGVREFMFVDLLGGKIPTAKAFLIGHVGFWIEKLLLSFQGGIFLIWAPKSYQRVTREDLERLKEETARERQVQATA